MPLSRDQELWGVALWVEKTQGLRSWFFVAQQQDRLLKSGDLDGARRWAEIGRRIEMLSADSSTKN